MRKVMIALLVVAALAVVLGRDSSSDYCGHGSACTQWWDDSAPIIIDR